MAYVMCKNCDTLLDSIDATPTESYDWLCEWCEQIKNKTRLEGINTMLQEKINTILEHGQKITITENLQGNTA